MTRRSDDRDGGHRRAGHRDEVTPDPRSRRTRSTAGERRSAGTRTAPPRPAAPTRVAARGAETRRPEPVSPVRRQHARELRAPRSAAHPAVRSRRTHAAAHRPARGRSAVATPAPSRSSAPLQRRAPRVRRQRVPLSLFRAGQSRRRLLAVFVISAVIFGIVVARVVMLQTSDAEALKEAGRAQRTSTTTLRASRGVIFDRNGDELALSVPSTTIIANPKLVTDPSNTVAVLAQLLDLSEEKQESLLTAFVVKEKSFAYIARQVDEELAAAVLALDLPGIDGIAEDRRTMPGGEVGKGVIGRTDIDGIGTAGIEMQFDDVLTGSDGEMTREHDRDGRSLPGTETTTVAPVPGDDVVLTIDRSVQYSVEQALIDQVTTIGAKSGTAIVMSTKTGEIIAMASVRRNDDGVVEVTSGNFAAVDAYEPGSVVKAATIAAALNEGTVTPDSLLEVPWQQQFSDTMLHDAEQHPTGMWPVSQILTESSNVGTIKTMLTMAPTLREVKEKQDAYLRAFGFGSATPLGFPGESNGILKDWKKWEGSEQYTVAYGQGIASTSIQLVTAINVLANGGTYVAPKLVKATIGPDGTVSDTAPAATHRVVSEKAAQEVNTIMRNVVCNGTATRAQVDGVTIAGKTGTGLKAQPGGGYLNEDGERSYYASFVGFFPAEDPQATVLVSIDEPPAGELTRFGGTAAAPVFARIAPSIMHELGITPPTADGGCPAS